MVAKEEANEPTKIGEALSEKATARKVRRDAFRTFSEKAADRISHIAKAVEGWGEFDAYYNAYVVPGGANGGQDQELVEVFFGNRILAETHKTKSNVRFASERGCSLRYELGLNGEVAVILVPGYGAAGAVNAVPLRLDVVRSASELCDSRLRKHIKWLVLSMKTTMNDRLATKWENIRYRWLSMRKVRYSIQRLPEDQWEWASDGRELSLIFSRTADWAARIGAGGILIVLFEQRFFPDPTPAAIQTQTQNLQPSIQQMLAKQATLANELAKFRSQVADELRAARELAIAHTPSASVSQITLPRPADVPPIEEAAITQPVLARQGPTKVTVMIE